MPVNGGLNQSYPLIKDRAKVEGAEIHWGDETGIQKDAHHERGYAPISMLHSCVVTLPG